MKFRILPLSVLAATVCSLPVSANTFTAQRAAQGFTQTTGDFTAALHNPALMQRYQNDDDIFVSANLGALISDQDDVIDDGESLADDLDQLVDDINSGVATPDQVEDVLGQLQSLDGKLAVLREGINAIAVIPNERISVGLFAHQTGKVAATIDYDDSDRQTLEDALITGDIALEDLNSRGLALGWSVAELGVMVSRTTRETEDYDVNVGMSFKAQRIDTLEYIVNVADFDSGDFDDSDFTRDETGFNTDIGMHLAYGDQRHWHFGFVASNLLSKKVETLSGDFAFKLEPTYVAGIGYDNGYFSAAIDLDLVEHAGFEIFDDVQYLSTGMELDLWEHAQLRGGFRTDLNGEELDIFTAGLGLSPWDKVRLDLTAIVGENDTLGGAIQIGIKM